MVQFNYSGLSKASGIYVIFNSYNWRIYVGSSKEFKNRWTNGHYKSLVKGKHQNKFLQSDFNKCRELLGHDDFLEFHVLENMPGSTREQRLATEEKWLRIHFDSGKQCYNLIDKALSREGFSDKKQRKTRNDKGTGKQVYYVKKGRKFGLPPWNKGKTNCYSTETLLLMKQGNFGKKHSEETKKKISQSNKDRNFSQETKDKIREACMKTKNHRFGKPMHENTKNALLKANKNRKLQDHVIDALRKSREKTYNVKLMDPDGNEHGPITNLSNFCKTHNLERSLLIKVIRNQRKHHKNWMLIST